MITILRNNYANGSARERLPGTGTDVGQIGGRKPFSVPDTFSWPDTFSRRIEPRSIGGSPPWWDNREVTIEDRKES
jgi:hypothetical protein